MKGDADPAFLDRMADVIQSLGGDDSVAALLDVHPKTVQKYRRGKSDPQFSQVVAIAEAAGVSVQWLATGEGPRDAAEAAASNVPPELLSAAQERAQSAGSPRALDPQLVEDIVSTYQDAVAFGLRSPLSPKGVARLVAGLHEEVLERRAQGETYSVNEFFHRVLEWPDVDRPRSSGCTGSPRVA